MKKRYSQSAENILAHSIKASRESRLNPRFPHKMKLHKGNAYRSKPIDHNSSSFPSVRMHQDPFKNASNVSKSYEPFSRMIPDEHVEDMKPWERLRNTFSGGNKEFPPKKQSILNYPVSSAFVVETDTTEQEIMHPDNSIDPHTSVQASARRCRECGEYIMTNTAEEAEFCEIHSENGPHCFFCKNKPREPEYYRYAVESKEPDPMLAKDNLSSVEEEILTLYKPFDDDSTETNSDRIPDVIKQAFTDDEDKSPPLKKKRDGSKSKVLKKFGWNEPAILNIRLVLLVLLSISIILLITSSDSGLLSAIDDLYFKSEETVEETPTFFHKCFEFLFSVTYTPKTSSFVTTWF